MPEQKNVQNEILEKLFENEDVKEAVMEYAAGEAADAVEKFKKTSAAKYGQPGKKKNLPVEPDCFENYGQGADELPSMCRSCHFVKGCKSGTKKTKKTDKK